MQESELNSTSFEVFKESPQKLLCLLNKYVKVELIKNTILCGFIHSIDPIQHSIILLEPHEEKFQTTMIPGHTILNVTEANADGNIEAPERKPLTAITENVVERKQKLMSWFKQNLLPVTESEENIVFGSVIILPPYNISDICTDNPIVAMRIQNIMNKMPDN